MKKLLKIYYYFKCRYCGRLCSNVGSGMNMGTNDRPMCERCYENGGDDN